jgi:hypothetical protein
MAYTPISGIVPQLIKNAGGAPASDHYLKGYQSGTTTPLSMGVDSTPSQTLAKCKLNTRGEPISNDIDETTVFIPHFNATYKLALYANATDADNDTTANAIWIVDGISGFFDASTITYTSSASVKQKLDNLDALDYLQLQAITTSQLADNDSCNVRYRLNENDGGGGVFHWDSSDLSAKVTADTQKGVYVPPNSDNTGASGCWVRQVTELGLSARFFGAQGDSSTDDTTAVQAAVNYVNSLTSGELIYFPSGTYKITTLITVPNKVRLVGAGMNTTRFNIATGISGFKFLDSPASNVVEGGGIWDCSISLDNAPIGIEIVDTWGVTVERIRFRDGGTTTGTLIKGSGAAFEIRVKDCRFVNGFTYSIDFQDDVNSSTIEGCDFNMPNNAVGINIADCNHIAIFNNRFEQSGSDQGNKIVLTNSNNNAIYGNTMGNSFTSTGIDILGTSQQNQIFGNRIATDQTPSIGIEIAGTADFNSITGNSFLLQGPSTAGIIVNGRTNTSITGNNFECTGSLGEGAVSLKGSSSQCAITGNVFSYTGAGNNSTGVLIASGSLDSIVSSNTFEGLAVGVNTQANNGSPTQIITNNSFRNNTTDVTIGTAASNMIKSNIGFITENTGTGSITSGSTSDTVAHGLDITPDKGKINVVLAEAATNDPGEIWVDSIDGTNFVVKCRNDPGASNLDFSWSIS